MASIFIFIFLLFFLPLIVLPFGISYFESPRVIVAEFVIILLLFIKLINQNFRIKNLDRKKILIASGLIIISLIHFVVYRTDNMFFGNIFRLQGIFLLWNLLIIFVFSEKIKEKWHIFAFISLVIQVPLALIISFNSNGRAIGTMGEPNSLAACVVFLWPFIFFFQKNRIIRFLSVLSSMFIIFLSQSRSGILAFIFQILFLVLINKFKISFKKAILLIFFAICAVIFLPFTVSYPYENRTEVWQSSFVAGIKKPILGYGFGNTEFAIHDATQSLNLKIKNNYVDSSHNVFLDYFVQGGVVGLALFLFAIFYFLQSVIKEKNYLSAILFIGLITTLSFNPMSVYILIAFWWLLGKRGKEFN